MTMTKKLFYSILFLLAAAIAPGSSLGNDPAPIHFVVIGDRTGGHVEGVYEQAVAEINRLKPDFVVTVGDMIEGYSSDTALLREQWNEYLQIASILTMPIYYTPGNHDITFDIALDPFRRKIGEPHHSFDISGIHFVVLDNSRWERSADIPKEQLDWLARDLAEHSQARYTFVLHHKPFWYNTTAAGKPDTLHALFRSGGVDAVFTGHFHQYFTGTYDGIRYTGVGSSGGGIDRYPIDLGYHFLWVTVDKGGLTMTPIKLGSALAWDEITAANLKAIERLNSSAIVFKSALRLDPDLNPVQAIFSVTVKNQLSGAPLDDTLRWEMTGGWQVSPAAVPVRLNAGDSINLTFSAVKGGNLYPTPNVVINMPYAAGKKAPISKTMPVQRLAHCLRAGEKVVLDGRLDEKFWSSPNLTPFDPEGNAATLDSTGFYFAYDDAALLLGAYCRESKMDSIAEQVLERDGAIYAEDCVGYFIQPDLDRAEVFQIYFNPRGTIFDQKISFDSDWGQDSDRGWNGEYEIMTYKGERFWSVEVRLPLAQFNVVPAAGKNMGLNFRRKQLRLHSASDWQVPIGAEPDNLGRLILK